MKIDNSKNLENMLAELRLVIPDYQRGYSWGKQQWEEFLDDLDLIPDDERQYMGVLTMQSLAHGEEVTVVDGQQRLTTILILCAEIRKRLGNEQNPDPAIRHLTDRLSSVLWVDVEGRTPRLRYATAPAEGGTLEKIFRGEIPNETSDDSVYSANLRKAALHFYDYLKDKQLPEAKKLGSRILKCLWFQPFSIDEWQAFIVFECLNNRGKKLSVMELLKNRLLYLSTLLRSPTDQAGEQATRNHIRDKVNETWKHIYKQIGLTKIEDDEPDTLFLRDHWIMRWTRKRSKEDAFKGHLLGEVFNARRVNSNRKDWLYIESDISDLRRFLCDLRVPHGDDSRKRIVKDIWANFEETRRLVEEGDNNNTDDETLRNALRTDLNYSLTSGDVSALGTCPSERRKALDKLFQNYLTEAEGTELKPSEIEGYCENLRDSVDCWVCQLQPAVLKRLFGGDVVTQHEPQIDQTWEWLRRLSDLQCAYCRPLVMAALLRLRKNPDGRTFVEANRLLERLERLAFWDGLVGRPGTRDRVQALAQKFWEETAKDPSDHQPWVEVAEQLDEIVGHSKAVRDALTERVKKRYDSSKGDGFYGLGNALRYLLLEYEHKLQLVKQEGEPKGLFHTHLEPRRSVKLSVEHVFPQEPRKWMDLGDWRNSFPTAATTPEDRERLLEERTLLTHSLGNLVYVTSSFNRDVSDHVYAEKREAYMAQPKEGCKHHGTLGTHEIATTYPSWAPRDILHRGLRLLRFIEERWSVYMGGIEEKVGLLHLTFVQPPAETQGIALSRELEDRSFASLSTLRGKKNMLKHHPELTKFATLGEFVSSLNKEPFSFYKSAGKCETLLCLQYDDLVMALLTV